MNGRVGGCRSFFHNHRAFVLFGTSFRLGGFRARILGEKMMSFFPLPLLFHFSTLHIFRIASAAMATAFT